MIRESLRMFSVGVFKRFWALVPGGILGALDVVERNTGKAIDVPAWVYWLVVAGGVLLAAFLAYHDLRCSIQRDSSFELRRKIGEEIGEIINEGAELAEPWPGFAVSEQEAVEKGVVWWNSAGEFIETTLGVGERHVISKPQRAKSREELLMAHVNLFRGTLERLPHLDIQVDAAGLQVAIEERRAMQRRI